MNTAQKSPVIISFFSLFFLSSFVVPNVGVTALSAITLAVIYLLLYRKGEPPILFFIVFFQWIQSSIKVLYANIKGQSIAEFQLNSDYHRASGDDTETAIILSLISLIVLSIGIWFVIRNLKVNKKKLLEEIFLIDTNKLLLLYAGTFVISTASKGIAFTIPQLAQPLMVVSSLKWIAFYILSVNFFLKKEKKNIFYIVIFVEFLFGISGIFSDFKILFFSLFIAILTLSYKLNTKTIITISFIGIIFFNIGIVWTGVKAEYRTYMVGDKRGSLTVETTMEDNLNKLYDLVSSFTKEQFEISLNALTDRVSYVDYFAFSINNVPKKIPYEEGALWAGAISNILKPRMLFPNKKALPSDSELTMKYTGLDLASDGASFSIGYIGEGYIDFGPLFMFIPIFIVGIFYGLIYKYFITKSRYIILGYTYSVVVLLIAYRLEIASIKLVGMIGIHFIFYYLFKKFCTKCFISLIKQKK